MPVDPIFSRQTLTPRERQKTSDIQSELNLPSFFSSPALPPAFQTPRVFQGGSHFRYLKKR